MRWNISTAIILGVVTFVIYCNSIPADFTYDDNRAIVRNPDVLGETPITSVWSHDFWGTPLDNSGSHQSYRPLCVLTFRLDHWLWGLWAPPYHMVNVLLHCAVTLLYAHFLSSLNTPPTLPPLAAVLFAVHPIHTEAVSSTVGRAELLSAFCTLVTLYLHRTFCTEARGARWLYLAGAVGTAAAGILCKEQAVMSLAVCVALDYFIYSKRKWHRFLISSIPCVFALLLLIYIRLCVLGRSLPVFAPADNPAADHADLVVRMLTFLYLPFVNMWLLLCPYTLSFDWSMDAIPLVTRVADMRNLCSLTMYITLTLLILGIRTNAAAKKHSKNNRLSNGSVANNHKPLINGTGNHHCHPLSKRPSSQMHHHVTLNSTISTPDLVAAALALLILPFIPASNLLYYVGFVVAERVLYTPSMGFVLLAAIGVERLHERESSRVISRGHQRVVYAAVLALIVLWSIRTVVRNRDWNNELLLYTSGVTVNPAKAWGNLGNIYNALGDVHNAEQAYKSALFYRGNMADVHYNLGILLQDQRRFTEAIQSYSTAIQYRPALSMAYLNLGIVLAAVNQKDEAAKMYKMCSDLDTTGLKDPRVHEHTKISALYNLGKLLADQEQYKEAIIAYEEAIRRKPESYGAQSLYNMLGEAHFKQNNLSMAEFWYQEALKIKPDHVPAHLTMAKLYHTKNIVEEAEMYYKKALVINDNDHTVYQHYGQFLADTGRIQEAASMYQKAVGLQPTDFELVLTTANVLRQAGLLSLAQQYYGLAADLHPDDPVAYMNLGAIQHMNGLLVEAESSYLIALTLKPYDQVTENNLKKLRALMDKTGSL